MKEKEVCVDVTGVSKLDEELVRCVVGIGVKKFISPDPSISKNIKEIGGEGVEVWSIEGENTDLKLLEGFDPDKIEAIKQDQPVGVRINIALKTDEENVVKAAKMGASVVVVSATDWKVIPVENLIAELHKTNTELFFSVKDAQEAKLMAETLELGVDGVVTKLSEKEDIEEILNVLRPTEEFLELTPAKIVEIRQVGSGDRACIDTCSLLRIGEGMLIGSQSAAFFLVHSETIETEFVASRPFRVNAGPVHAYILMANGKTKYLSEIASGDEVLVVDADGATRTAIVGRSKIEKRPLLLIKAKVGDFEMSTLCQNAETIRLVTKNKDPIAVTELKEGDEVLVHLAGSARHFGMAVEEETIIEK
ncbi:MAG: 3-dehydroquinate synthase II [Candidatus Hodarchaeota archaeon]